MLGETFNNYKGKATSRISMGKAPLPFNTNSRKYNGNKNKLKFSTIHIEGKKVATFQSHVYVPLKVVDPVNKCLPS
jgi:hypothetical protein